MSELGFFESLPIFVVGDCAHIGEDCRPVAVPTYTLSVLLSLPYEWYQNDTKYGAGAIELKSIVDMEILVPGGASVESTYAYVPAKEF